MKSKSLRILFPDQLSHALYQKDEHILMIEAMEAFTNVKHHKKKIAFILASMRNFFEEIQKNTAHCDYIELNNSENSYLATIKKYLEKSSFDKIICTEPSEYWLLKEVSSWKTKLSIDVIIEEDMRFFCSKTEFKKWSEGKKSLLMEDFYRFIRKKSGILMNGGKPEGGKFNFDKENRNPLKKNVSFKHFEAKRNKIDSEVLAITESHFTSHFGDMHPFYLATTRKEALKSLLYFIDNHLPNFGAYQDAMIEDEPFLFHSILSPYINIGLLSPHEVVEAALSSYEAGKAPINSVEGFIRQVIGWREFIRGVYWLHMPKYATLNHLGAKSRLPSFFWDAKTKMNCMRSVIDMTKKYAYSHHIQRLMVTGNFSLIAGLSPEQVCEWYLIVYADAYDWVELPNTLGMTLFGDGGIIGTKPYAASGNYINKMSNFCKGCGYNVKEKTTDDACPFNFLYWDFMIRNEKILKNNQRMRFPYQTLAKMDNKLKSEIQKKAAAFFKSLK